MPNCIFCGEETTKPRFCCHLCKSRWYYSKRINSSSVAICKHCYKEFKPKALDRTAYCSRECYQAYKKAHAKTTEAKLAVKCPICNKPAYGKEFYCSDECRKESARRKNKEYKASKHKPELKHCQECNKEYMSFYGDSNSGFCSNLCSRRYYRRIAKHMRRARKYKTNYEVVNPISIFIRDHWHCKLCGISTPKRLRGTIKDNAPELDHVIPLSLGGSHNHINLQCLCRKCNRAKGATALGQIVLC